MLTVSPLTMATSQCVLFFILAISVPIQTQTLLPDLNTMVECRADRSCVGSPVNSTIKDCCDHDIVPSGLAYTIPGEDDCQLCPVGVTVGFERTTYSVDEGNVVEVCAMLNGTLKMSVEVSVSSSSGSAIVNEDYNSVVEVLTFDQATNRACFNVITVEDQILEETTENMNLILNTLDRNVTLFPDLAQVSIRDNDRVRFGLNNTSLTLNEGGGATARVCVIVTTGTLGRDVIVTLYTVDGTATSVEPADFVALLKNITFSPGDREICQDISILDDTLYEEDESFSALLNTGDSSADIDQGQQSTTIIIMDTDEITIGFTRESDMVEEDVDTTIIICVEVKNNGMLEKFITVQLDTVDGTATANKDYNSTSYSLVFTPDNERDQQCRAVNILSDDYLEGTETFMATLSTRDDRVSLDPDTEAIIIVDNDVVNVLFIGDPFEGEEDNGFVAIIVGVMEPENLKTEVSVNLTTEDIVGISNAATAGVDYRPLDVTLTFSETVTAIIVNVTLLNDNALEGDEDFKARLSTSSGSNVGLWSDTIITIVDDDGVTIGFEEETVQVDENIGMKTLCVNVSYGQLARTTTVSVSSQDQTAINGQDYSAQQMTITFSRDNPRQCFNVSILDDNINEPEKIFLVRLTTGDPQVTLSPNMTTITIMDDDVVAIGFEEETVQVAENIGMKTLCVNVSYGQLVHTTTVNVSYQDQTAINGQDYIAEQMTFTFSRDDTRQCFDVSIFDDDINEPENKFLVMLSTGDPRITLSPDMATITILDNDEAVIGFLSERYNVSESAGTASIEFGVITGTLESISVQLSFSDGSALFGSDYNSSEKVYSLTGRETVTVDIGIIEDDKFEQAEVFCAILSFINIRRNVTITPHHTEIVISDDDTLIFSFRHHAHSFLENIGTSTVYVDKINGFTDLNITLQVSGILQGGQRLVQPITFSPLDSEKPITFNIADDLIVLEPPERFMLTLTVVTISDRILLQPNDRLDISIIDDDELIIGFAQNISVSESENATLCITFSSEFSTNFSISIGPLLQHNLTLPGIAESGADYYLPNFSIEAISTLHGPNNNLCFDVSIIQDELLEYEECFVAVISLPNSVSGSLLVEIAGDKDTAVVCIENDDRITISFDHSMYSVGENAGRVQISASLVQGGLGRPVEVLFSTMSGTATSEDPKDFQSLQGVVLQYNDTIHQAGVSVTIINDNIFEKEEKFFASLITNDANVNFGINNVTITIYDYGDGARFGFDPVQYRVNEGAGSVTLFVVLLEGTLEREVNLQFSTVEGTAMVSAPVDYVTDTRTITFSSSVSNVSVSVTIYNDDILEPTENFLGNLTDPQRRATVSIIPNTANVDIMDNDELSIGFVRNVSVPESENATLCITFSSEVSTNFRINVGPHPLQDNLTLPRIAEPGIDYYLPNSSIEAISFLHGPNNNLCFDVSIIQDEFLEYEECFVAVISLPNTVSDRLMVEIAGGKDTALVCIENDDRVTISIDHSMYSVRENAGHVQISVSVVQSGLGKPVDVLFSTMSGTATSEDPRDFQSLQSVLFQFNDNILQKVVSITIINDDIFENEEKFFASLITNNATNNADVDFGIKNATITIYDDDSARFGFDSVHYRVNEDAGSVTLFVVLLEGTLEREVNLQFSTVEGTAMASAPADYQTDTRTVTFSSSVSNVSVSVTIYDDDILESTENFLGNLADPSSQATVSIMPHTANVDIMDNDRVTIGFERTNYLVKEGNVVEVCAVLSGTLRRTLDVFINSSSGSATVTKDYNPVHETLTFGPTSNRACFNFTSLEDEIHEEDMEDLNLHLSTIVSSAILNPILARVQIFDDERATEPTIDNAISNNHSHVLAIVVVTGVVIIVAMVIIAIVLIVVFRYRRHSALDHQKNSGSEPLELSSVNAVKEDLDVLVYSNEEVDEMQ